jgi:septal ring factor EnvC (AmiA/AmiB activator)
MKKLALIAFLAIGLTAFVGTDVIKSSMGSVRTSVRDALTAEVPLQNQLAEAQVQVDSYAESIIRGEVAAENLRDMIGGVEREVRGLTVRVDHERGVLASLRDGMSGTSTSGPSANGEVLTASTLKPVVAKDQRETLRRVRSFKASSELLGRRHSDLARLKREYGTTLGSLEEARGEQSRLGEEIRVLAAELESLSARKAAARTRNAVGDSSISGSGFHVAQDRIKKIRSKLREQNKLLQYYEYERVVRVDGTTGTSMVDMSADPVAAIDEALASYPAK